MLDENTTKKALRVYWSKARNPNDVYSTKSRAMLKGNQHQLQHETQEVEVRFTTTKTYIAIQYTEYQRLRITRARSVLSNMQHWFRCGLWANRQKKNIPVCSIADIPHIQSSDDAFIGRRDTYHTSTKGVPQTAQHIHKSHSSVDGSEITAACPCLLWYDRGTENNRQRSYGAGANTKASLWRFMCRLILPTKHWESTPCTQRAECWAKETVN